MSEATWNGRGAMIASLEYTYWRDLPAPSHNEEFLKGCQLGAMGAAANICAALALGKTVEEFQADLATRGLPLQLSAHPKAEEPRSQSTLTPEKDTGADS